MMKHSNFCRFIFGFGLTVFTPFVGIAADSQDQYGIDEEQEASRAPLVLDLNQLRSFCVNEKTEMDRFLKGVTDYCEEAKASIEELAEEGAPGYQLDIAKGRLDTCDQVTRKIEKDMVALKKKCNQILLEAFSGSDLN